MTAEQRVCRAVILARGLGTRMRRADHETTLSEQQASVAETGLKAMIPIGRPFLDYVLSALADAGFRDVCLVIGPEHNAIREYYTRTALTRLRVSFAVQERPLGTADAVLAAESFAGGEFFLVINSDNLSTAEVLAELRRQTEPALLGFRRESLITDGNIPPERIASFALLEADADGYLRRIVEKPDKAALRAMGDAALVSINFWLFSPEIFPACRAVGLSPRGELELPDAVQYATDVLGLRFKVVPVNAPVLDLSSRADIPAVAARLTGAELEL